VEYFVCLSFKWHIHRVLNQQCFVHNFNKFTLIIVILDKQYQEITANSDAMNVKPTYSVLLLSLAKCFL